LIIELGYDVNPAKPNGCTPCFVAAQIGNLAVLRYLVKELGADINQKTHNDFTPLMIASYNKHADIVRWLIKEGADTQASIHLEGVDELMMAVGMSIETDAYLEAKTYCSNPDCSGARIKRCPACKQARYCGEPCQYEHWKAHKADCKRWSAELRAKDT
jgi:ankyrin repeat protein